MATRRKSASRVQTETLDDQNPSNWTTSQLKAALALGQGSTSLGIAPSYNSTIPVYFTNSSTPGKFGFPASSFSAIDMVSPELRNDIITGKDVNLNMLLIPNYEFQTLLLKKNKEFDVRLQRNLSMDEFVIAFGRFKRIMGTAFPNRNEELDLYLAHIIETANIWPDCFYEYHKIFSAKCTVMLIQHSIKIDWSKGDSDLRNMVCAGSKINTCRKCHSTTHSIVMCSVQQQNFQPQRNSRNTPDSLGCDVIFVDGLPVCNNFNGFKVSDINISTYECKNALSARKDPDSVTALIQDELVKGFIQGTFLHPPFSVYRIDASPHLKTVISKASNIVRYVRKSINASDILEGEKRLQADNATRWNSQITMIRSVLEVSEEKLNKLDTIKLTGYERKLLQELCLVLKPFEDATIMVQKEINVSGSLAVPVTLGLEHKLAELSTTYNNKMVSTLMSSMTKRLSCFKSEDVYLISAILDPRFKLRWSKDPVAMEEKLLTYARKQKVDCENYSDESSPPRKMSKSDDTGLFSFMTPTKGRKKHISGDIVKMEISQYLLEPCDDAYKMQLNTPVITNRLRHHSKPTPPEQDSSKKIAMSSSGTSPVDIDPNAIHYVSVPTGLSSLQYQPTTETT
ncbi:unnamed protein product [Mytilus edulis]|uniref:Uncharacterized protein n=1 Tax=Mytilus edulis TaxID=6550 RepID=A0A8S3R2A7_MYTED|nr:unnamed protein product [Mytilus edulis]